MQTGIIIQARLGSKRLPNKMILPFYEDQGIFEILLKRLIEAFDRKKIPIILATTTNSLDDELERIAVNNGVSVIRGSENDVLDRFIKAATAYNISNIIRVCADNPFLDITQLQMLIEKSERKKTDYYSFATSNTKPTILTSYGFWAESVSIDALKRVASTTNEKLYREHVTNYVYKHPDQFHIEYEFIDPKLEEHKDIRLTVDTRADFDLVKKIYRILKEKKVDFKAETIANLVASEPKWKEIMKIEISANKK